MSLDLLSRFAISVSPSHGNNNQYPGLVMFQSRFRVLQRYPTVRLGFKLCPCSRRAHETDGVAAARAPIIDGFPVVDFDSFLSFAEIVCIASSAVVSAAFAANYAVLGLRNEILGEMWKRVALCGVAGLVGGVVIGAWIRRRQWKRICRDSVRGEGLSSIKRIEKVEEELRNSATIIRVLSKHLEKLGIRFRVMKNTLKQPITETAALAQKNSEATRSLAAQEDILEKEIREIQKVLLAMQEQQQKQLDLILTIAKHSKLWETKPRSKGSSNLGAKACSSSNDVKDEENQTNSELAPDDRQKEPCA